MLKNDRKGKIIWTPNKGEGPPKPDRYGARTWRGAGVSGMYEWISWPDGTWSAYFFPFGNPSVSEELAIGVSAHTSYRACTAHNRPGMAGAGRGA
jgi:hypothetical protein